MRSWTLHLGDCAEGLRELTDDSVDALVTDPPAGIGFMNRDWDSDKGGRVSWISWLESVMREALRVMKPGAHGLVWALPRTSHWTATALEQAGFEVRDVITHHFGTGFPKSLNISKAIDEAAGAEREVVGINEAALRPNRARVGLLDQGGATKTAPATDAAKQWDGWGTALKPATEHWILVRKPLAGTVASNVLAHGTGGLNVDACRIGTDGRPKVVAPGTGRGGRTSYDVGSGYHEGVTTEGRWPANLVLSHTEWCEPAGTTTVPAAGGDIGKHTAAAAAARGDAVAMGAHGSPRGEWKAHGNGDGTETVTAWRCLPGCPVALLDAQSWTLKSGERASGSYNRHGLRGNAVTTTEKAYSGDTGGASRFFYVSKPTTAEREADTGLLPRRAAAELTDRKEESAGLSNPRAGAGRTSKGRANIHPTVKAIDLMSWLVKLITPPGGMVLDPFAGSGSTGVAALRCGFRFVGFERDADYHRVASARIGAALHGPLFAEVA